MADEGFKRKLAAILSADVEGYSRLMDNDEEATVRTLTAYRSAINDLVQQYRGRIVDTPGDNILAEFTSVVDAMNCAVKIQRELAERNAELPYDRRMEFRIGVNLGDVIEEEGRIYGDGVNIAARVEAMTEAGGICISGRVYDQVENKLGLEYKNLGEHKVKNISTPIRIYRVVIEHDLSTNFTSGKTTDFKQPDKPSIAVLPFLNISGDPTQEYFCDGLSDHIITLISKYPDLIVIARNSTFTYKNRMVKVQQICQDLGVRYVLEGSVQRSGERVRITAQLIDAKTGHHLWADNFDRDLADIFDLQDEIAMEILLALRVKLTMGEQARHLETGGTKNLKAFELFFQARHCFSMGNQHDIAQAKHLFEEAISIDPDFAVAYSMMASCHFLDFVYSWSESPIESFSLSEQFAKKALGLNDALDLPYAVLGYIYALTKQFDKAIESCEKAVSLNPNGAIAHAVLGYILSMSDRTEKGLVHLKKSIRLNPRTPPITWIFLGVAYRMAGQYEESIKCCKKAIKEYPDNLVANLVLTGSYSLMGLEEQARKTVHKVLQIDPDFSLENFSKIVPIKNKAKLNLYIDALRKAGLPD